MSTVVLTLFGEEIIPEQLNAVGRSRSAKKNKDEDGTEKPKKERKPKTVTPKEEIPEEAAQDESTLLVEDVTAVQEVIEKETIPTGEMSLKDTLAAARKAASKEKKAKTVVAPVTSEDEPIDSAVLKDWAGEKQYYSIGEVAALFNVNTSNIRFWTKQFAMKVRTTRKGDRLYTPDQVREIRTIYHLVKEKRYTIAGAKGKMKTQKNTTVQSMDVRTALLQLRNKLVGIRNELL